MTNIIYRCHLCETQFPDFGTYAFHMTSHNESESRRYVQAQRWKPEIPAVSPDTADPDAAIAAAREVALKERLEWRPRDHQEARFRESDEYDRTFHPCIDCRHVWVYEPRIRCRDCEEHKRRADELDIAFRGP